MKKPLLTTKLACRVACRNGKLNHELANRFNADRLNEAAASGEFPCAPETVRGRSRLFDPDDMVALWLFLDLMDDGFRPEMAGRIACEVAKVARAYPEAPTISYVRDYFNGPGAAYPTSVIPDPKHWDTVLFSGCDIRAVLTFRISKTRALIAHYTEEERNILGEDD